MKPSSIIKKIIENIRKKNLQSHAAALAFFGLFSLGPILFIILLLLSPTGIDSGLEENLPEEINTTITQEITPLSKSTNFNHTIAIIVGAAIILFGATRLFDELVRSLNAVFCVKNKKRSFLKIIKKKGISFLIILILAALIIFSTGISSAITIVSQILQLSGFVIILLTAIANFILLILFLSLLYKTLPDCTLSGKQVMIGAIISAVLVFIGQALISTYISNINLTETYGAASTIILLLIWAYYTAFAFLIGAEISNIKNT